MEIRAFATSDTDRIVELWAACGLTRPWNDPHLDIARKLSVQPELFLVGVLDSRIVATVMAGYEGHRGWVNYLAVDPDSSGRGLARTLMTEVERLLEERGCPKLNLQVRADNAAAIHFYEAIGYTLDGSVSLGKRLIADW